ncbi:CvpA family protein [Patescibacteria group bacterium]|nr:CvpA family protein [Patescibacteria group bacterium]MBU1472789.1 CvpA family protein [Patescibacteria group bacterium]MBU2459736.1 CvpA family protein [Patescibacteria group bacterium]MBU2544408.1 CvpA family protein [Patescibacteria group bacterium]
MSFSWIDIIILVVVAYYIVEGWQQGLVSLLLATVSFLGSLWLAVRYSGLVGGFLMEKFAFSSLWTNVIGYLFVGIVGGSILHAIVFRLGSRILHKSQSSSPNKALGALVSTINAYILTVFFLLVVLALPLRGTIREDVNDSTLGRSLVILAERYGGKTKSSLDKATQKVAQFMTVAPLSLEKQALDIPVGIDDLSTDKRMEDQMIQLINEERKKDGKQKLQLDYDLRYMARTHSQDMLVQKYFSHFDPEGNGIEFRAKQSNVSYQLLGENLAFTPDLSTAHEGFMNSEEHKENIMDSQFHRIGIGIVSAGVYGKMITQVFAD